MRTFTFFSILGLLFAANAEAQYCMLPGRTSYSTQQPGITNFKLNTINRTSLGVEQALSLPPVVVTTDTTTLMRGQTYTVIIAHSKDATNFPTERNNIRVWIDYNKDFDFVDAGETVITQDNNPPGTIDTMTFTVPMTAPLGYTRLRATAKMGPDAGHTVPTSCDVPADPIDYHGEMEDYTVKIADPTAVNEVNASVAISVYPNPTDGKLTLEFNETAAISLYDFTGKQIVNIASGQALSPFVIDLNDHKLPQGIYILKAETANAVSYQKVLKVNP